MFRVKEAQCGQVYSLHSGSGDSRVVPDQGAVLDIKETLFSESDFYIELVCRGYMIIRRPEGAGWYDLVLLKNNIEEGADSEEEQWVTGSESESDTDDSDTEDGQDDF